MRMFPLFFFFLLFLDRLELDSQTRPNQPIQPVPTCSNVAPRLPADEQRAQTGSERQRHQRPRRLPHSLSQLPFPSNSMWNPMANRFLICFRHVGITFFPWRDRSPSEASSPVPLRRFPSSASKNTHRAQPTPSDPAAGLAPQVRNRSSPISDPRRKT